MTLLEALKSCSVENMETTELIYDCSLEECPEDQESYDKFIEALKAIAGDDLFEKFATVELTDELKQAIINDEDLEEFEWTSVAYLICAAAYASYNNFDDYEFCVEETEYEIGLFDKLFTWEGDIDTL